MKKLSIVVPVYYNAQSLPLLFEELLLVENELSKKSIEMELIFVDDGSGDESWQVLLDIKRKREGTRLVKLTRNFGSVHALKIGFKFVTGDCFMALAADLQDPPELIVKMAEKWLRGVKFVICERAGREDPPVTKLFASIYYKLLRFFVMRDFPRGGFDLALMDQAMLPYLQNSAKNINTLLFAYWLGFKPDVMQYTRRERVHGKSRWTLAKKITLFLDSILGFSIIPIRLMSLIGIVVATVSMGYGFLIIINVFLGNAEVRGFATIVTLITFLLGLVIFMLGVIGEYVWRSFDEVNRRPEAVIDEVY